MNSKEYLKQIATTEVIDCTYNDKAKKRIDNIFPVGISVIEKDLEVLEMLKNKVCFIEKINPKFWLDKDVYNETCNYDYYKWVVKE